MNQAKFKAGDKVRVISLEKIDCETQNWIKKETDAVNVGDTFIVQSVYNGWLQISRLEFSHPAEKFELVKN